LPILTFARVRSWTVPAQSRLPAGQVIFSGSFAPLATREEDAIRPAGAGPLGRFGAGVGGVPDGFVGAPAIATPAKGDATSGLKLVPAPASGRVTFVAPGWQSMKKFAPPGRSRRPAAHASVAEPRPADGGGRRGAQRTGLTRRRSAGCAHGFRVRHRRRLTRTEARAASAWGRRSAGA
jgi:hypothetical protein